MSHGDELCDGKVCKETGGDDRERRKIEIMTVLKNLDSLE